MIRQSAGMDSASRTSAALAEAKEIMTTLSRSFQERQVEETLFSRGL
jgi:hypothetical protein